MYNKRIWYQTNRKSHCCEAEVDVYPDENGVLKYKCKQCIKVCYPAKMYPYKQKQPYGKKK